MVNKYASVIVLKLPDGLHYYCGKVKYQGHFVDEWDLDITYAIIYFNKIVAKKRCGVLRIAKAQATAQVKDFFRLPPDEKSKRMNDVKLFYSKQNNG